MLRSFILYSRAAKGLSGILRRVERPRASLFALCGRGLSTAVHVDDHDAMGGGKGLSSNAVKLVAKGSSSITLRSWLPS